jgi:hypothetical protein
LPPSTRKKNSGNGCCTKNCAGPWTGGGGRGRVWEGRWGLYKGPQRPHASRISSPTARSARVQPYIGLFPPKACLCPLQRGGRGQGYRVSTARVITPRARVESQRGELRTGTGIHLWVSGLAIYLLFPPKACLCPLQRGGRGQGYRVPTALVITPRARVESQRGELRTGTGMRHRVSGSAIYWLFPPKLCPYPPQRGGLGQG